MRKESEMNSEEAVFHTALEFFKSMLDKKRESGGSSQDIAKLRATLALAVGVHDKTFQGWMNDIESAKKVTPKRMREVNRAFRHIEKNTQKDWYLASAVSAHLGLTDSFDFRIFKKYEGDYIIYRLGRTEDFITGIFRITNNADTTPYMHVHTSEQKIGDTIRRYDHSGPIFCVNRRIYVLGIGSSNVAAYFRPMILHAVLEPKRLVTFGILLTESAQTDGPMATKVALIPRESKRNSDSQFLDSLRSYLKGSQERPHIIHTVMDEIEV